MFSLILTRSDFAPLHSSFSLEKKKEEEEANSRQERKRNKANECTLGNTQNFSSNMSSEGDENCQHLVQTEKSAHHTVSSN